MASYKNSITELVGNTPLLKLGNYAKNNELGANIFAKLEYFNATGSIKDRIAINMIEQAEADGIIKPGDTIVENTSGNTGIGLAAFAAAKGYKLEVFLETGASKEREQLLEAYGAVLHHYFDLPKYKKSFEEGTVTFQAFMDEIYEYAESKGAFFINQLTNEANPDAHRKTTGPEIWEALDGKVDILVLSVGTGGTLLGLGSYLKEKNPDLEIVTIEPAPESLITPQNPDANIIDGIIYFNGFPKEYLTSILQQAEYDECIDVKTEDAWAVSRELIRTEGLFVGTSSAAALYGAAEVAKRPENKGKNIVVIMPDNGMKYLTTGMFD